MENYKIDKNEIRKNGKYQIKNYIYRQDPVSRCSLYILISLMKVEPPSSFSYPN